ncbi:hypothetical protein BH23CHL1_BH23CHL1_13900 [soil metagenome]
MFRSSSRPFTGVFVLVFFLSIVAQVTVNVVGAQATGTVSAEVHHLGPPPDAWQSRLTDDRDLQLVIGTDERVRISPTNVRPYQSIAYLEAWDDDTGRAFTCTATFIGPKTLLTAAHCLWIDEFGGWPSGVAIAPGKDGDDNPFGVEFADKLWVPNGWKDATGNSAERFKWDFALVTLASATPGETVGALGIGVFSGATLQSEDFNPVTSGYPGDKQWGTQWTSTQPSFDKIDATHLQNSIDAFQGQSGSGVWSANDGRIAGIVSFETRTKNYALRIDQRVLDGLLDACDLLQCEFNYSIEGEVPDPQPTPGSTPANPPQPTPLPEPPPSLPPGPTPAPALTDSATFDAAWERTDRPVSDGAANRTWMWGPEAFTDPVRELYTDSPGGQRAVQYFDKSRMEITNPGGDPSSVWYVTNGLLVRELITGELQTGDGSFESHQPADVNVAGDSDDPNSPTYATFNGLLDAPAHAEGAAVTQRLDGSGTVRTDPTLAEQGVTAARYVPESGHSVASVFWTFMNAQDIVYENGGFTSGPLFQNPFYATGLPVSEPYWATVEVGGAEQIVLIQAFERRVLTYTPGNAPGWQVEAGNVGQHYYQWRYGEVGGG